MKKRRIRKLCSVVMAFALFGTTLTSCMYFSVNKQKTESSAEADSLDNEAMKNSNHLKFKGVPLDGTLDVFVKRMENKGFECERNENGAALLGGEFSGFKDCKVVVPTLKDKDLVSGVVVIFPSHDQWGQLLQDYNQLKTMIVEKYGTPSSCVEEFDGMPVDDFDRMQCVKLDKCRYKTVFSVDKGEITLTIGHDEMSNCFVSLAYADEINRRAIREHAKDDL